jgi:molybdate transport system substrate-binding protein
MTLAALIAAGARFASVASVFGFIGAMAAAGVATAAEIKVLGSPGTRAPYTLLVPGFEETSGNKVTTTWGGVTEVAKRVAGGEVADVIMLPAAQIDDLIKQGKLIAATRVNVATSGVGVAIRAGAPKIDASTSDGIRNALVAARKIAFSTGPSGLHIERLIAKWGLTDELKAKIVPPVPNVPIGEVVARGDADIGFQQVSELLPVKGIDYLGPLPPDIQETTVFSAAVHNAAGPVDAAKALLTYLTAPEAAAIIRKTGMEPAR